MAIKDGNGRSELYQENRNGQLDLARAELEAERLRKIVFLFVGGDWCAPCGALKRTFTKRSSLTRILNDNFVVVYLNVSKENTNECALRNLPDIPSYPTVYFFDAKGTLLASHNRLTGSPSKFLTLSG
jgi:thioredoxin-related protein